MSLILLTPTVMCRIGFGPSEINTSNRRDTPIVGTASLINGEDYPQYGVFSLFIPYTNKDTFRIVESEIIHARVLCPECGESYQRYEVIPGYKYGDPLNGKCPACNSDLRFYTPVPRDELGYFSLEGAENFDLIPVTDKLLTWITKQQITARGMCKVNVLYDASESYLKENIGQHWEIHLRGTAQREGGSGDMVTGGIDIRVLVSFKFLLFIDVPDRIEKGKTFEANVTYGDPSGTWGEIPDEAYVIFNGVTKPVDEKGCVVFNVPDTRKDYEYDIKAEGDKYLSVTKTLTTAENINEGSSVSSTLAYILIIIIVTVILAIAIWYVIQKKERRLL